MECGGEDDVNSGPTIESSWVTHGVSDGGPGPARYYFITAGDNGPGPADEGNDGVRNEIWGRSDGVRG